MTSLRRSSASTANLSPPTCGCACCPSASTTPATVVLLTRVAAQVGWLAGWLVIVGCACILSRVVHECVLSAVLRLVCVQRCVLRVCVCVGAFCRFVCRTELPVTCVDQRRVHSVGRGCVHDARAQLPCHQPNHRGALLRSCARLRVRVCLPAWVGGELHRWWVVAVR